MTLGKPLVLSALDSSPRPCTPLVKVTLVYYFKQQDTCFKPSNIFSDKAHVGKLIEMSNKASLN